MLLASRLHRTRVALRARSISAGSDVTSKLLSLQKCRPWHMDGQSNQAVDNAVPLSDLFGPGRKVALFGVPAPFTGTCTTAHVPPYKALADEFAAKGVDELVCFSVADPYAHHAWAKAMGVDLSKISFLCDPDGSVTAAWELAADYSATNLGERSKRFSMVVNDGAVSSFQLVDEAEKDAEVLLGQC